MELKNWQSMSSRLTIRFRAYLAWAVLETNLDAIVAHQLTFKRANVEPKVIAVRVGFGLLTGAGVRLEPKLGTTGVHRADRRHMILLRLANRLDKESSVSFWRDFRRGRRSGCDRVQRSDEEPHGQPS